MKRKQWHGQKIFIYININLFIWCAHSFTFWWNERKSNKLYPFEWAAKDRSLSCTLMNWSCWIAAVILSHNIIYGINGICDFWIYVGVYDMLENSIDFNSFLSTSSLICYRFLNFYLYHWHQWIQCIECKALGQMDRCTFLQYIQSPAH